MLRGSTRGAKNYLALKLKPKSNFCIPNNQTNPRLELSSEGFVFLKTIILLSVDCQWSSWHSSGSCSATCGDGSQKYKRYKTILESDGGSCSGSIDRYEACNSQACPSKFSGSFYVKLK